MKKYKIITSKQKCGKQHPVEEIAKEIIASQNKKQKKEQYDNDDSAGMEYIQDMLDNF